MTTRAELRTALRGRLEDAGASPLWDDAALNEAIGEGVRAYGARVPRQATASVAVAEGATSAPVAGVDPDRVVRVRDGTGAAVPRWSESDDGTGPGQAWRWWDGALQLARPAAAGTWQVEHLAGRTPPADDAAAVDLGPGDEEVVLALARAAALRRRATEEAKRGLPPAAAPLARAAADDAERLLAAGRRRARGGWL